MRVNDITGQRFAHLTVIKKSERKNAKQQAFWVCKCDCGNLIVVRGDNLRRGISKQCSECNNERGRKSIFYKGGKKNEVSEMQL